MLNNKDIERQKRYTEQGIEYGYPSCCVQNFVSKAIKDYWYLDEQHLTNSIFKGTGYLPCRKCSEKVKGLGKEESSFLLLGRNIFI